MAAPVPSWSAGRSSSRSGRTPRRPCCAANSAAVDPTCRPPPASSPGSRWGTPRTSAPAGLPAAPVRLARVADRAAGRLVHARPARRARPHRTELRAGHARGAAVPARRSTPRCSTSTARGGACSPTSVPVGVPRPAGAARVLADTPLDPQCGPGTGDGAGRAHTMRISFPVTWPPAISRCASAACASGKVRRPAPRSSPACRGRGQLARGRRSDLVAGVGAGASTQQLDAVGRPAERGDGDDAVPIRHQFERHVDGLVGADQIHGRVDAVRGDGRTRSASPSPYATGIAPSARAGRAWPGWP